MKKILLLVLILGLSFSSCEKDDICDPNTPTTPRMIITFYDVQNPSNAKTVNNLLIVADGLATGILFNGVNKIQVPLDLNSDTVNYNFILNSGNANPALIYTDKLQFNYTRKTVYVSRACGYKTVFNLINDNDLATPNPFVLNNNPILADGNWIKNIIIEKYNLESENETHIKIYF